MAVQSRERDDLLDAFTLWEASVVRNRPVIGEQLVKVTLQTV